MDYLWFVLSASSTLYWGCNTCRHIKEERESLATFTSVVAGISALGILLSAESILK